MASRFIECDSKSEIKSYNKTSEYIECYIKKIGTICNNEFIFKIIIRFMMKEKRFDILISIYNTEKFEYFNEFSFPLGLNFESNLQKSISNIIYERRILKNDNKYDFNMILNYFMGSQLDTKYDCIELNYIKFYYLLGH